MSAVPLPRNTPAGDRPIRRQAAPAPAPAPRLRVVAPPRHIRRYVAATVLAAGIAIFGTVALNAMAAEHAFAARALSDEVRELTLRSDELTVEIATLDSPERIKDVAVRELGMVPAEQPGYLVVGVASVESDVSGGTILPTASSGGRAPQQ